MRRLVIFLVVLLVVAPMPAHAAAPAGYVESFERDFGGWEARSDGHVIGDDWKVSRSPETAFDGKYSLQYDVNGRGDDGTVWVQREFPVPPGSRQVELSFAVLSKQQSIVGWPIVAYAGPKAPGVEQDFTIVGQLDRWIGWKQFSLRKPVPFGATSVTLAFGLSVTWETKRTDYLDYAQVTFS